MGQVGHFEWDAIILLLRQELAQLRHEGADILEHQFIILVAGGAIAFRTFAPEQWNALFGAAAVDTPEATQPVEETPVEETQNPAGETEEGGDA